MNHRIFSAGVPVITLLLLAVVPLTLYQIGQTFWLDLFTRLLILTLAALSLNLLLGFSGLVSFGHAAFIGLGAYAVGIPVYHETYGGAEWLASYNGFVHFALAVGVCAVFALITGVICLRTRGVHFIMITMAFSQMIYYTLISIDEYGADDGLTIDLRSEFPLISLDDPLQLFLVCFVSVLLFLFIISRLTNSSFGNVLAGARQNEQRLQALGLNPFVYRLVVYVIAGAMCGYAGALMANYSTFISPSMVEWTRSGELMFMVILGGAGYLFGPVFGALVFIILEYFLSQWTIYWHLPFGLLLIATVLFFKGGFGKFLQRNRVQES
jgi:branched-chain amino acid transport system permease protein